MKSTNEHALMEHYKHLPYQARIRKVKRILKQDRIRDFRMRSNQRLKITYLEGAFCVKAGKQFIGAFVHRKQADQLIRELLALPAPVRKAKVYVLAKAYEAHLKQYRVKII